MKIPENIKVGGHDIRVEFSDSAHIDALGEYVCARNLIRLKQETESTECNVAECLLHEIIECINAKNDLRMEHTAITVLSEVLFQVLRDNQLNFCKPDKGEKK